MSSSKHRYEARCLKCGANVPFEGPAPEALLSQATPGGDVNFSTRADACQRCGAPLSPEAASAAAEKAVNEVLSEDLKQATNDFVSASKEFRARLEAGGSEQEKEPEEPKPSADQPELPSQTPQSKASSAQTSGGAQPRKGERFSLSGKGVRNLLILTALFAGLLAWMPVEVGGPGNYLPKSEVRLESLVILVPTWVLLTALLVLGDAKTRRPFMEIAGSGARALMWMAYLTVTLLWFPGFIFGVPSWGLTVLAAAAITGSLCSRLWPPQTADRMIFGGALGVAGVIVVELVVSIAVHAPIGYLGLGLGGVGGMVIALFFGIMGGGTSESTNLPDDRDPSRIDARLYRHYRGNPPILDPDETRSGDLGYRTPYRG